MWVCVGVARMVLDFYRPSHYSKQSTPVFPMFLLFRSSLSFPHKCENSLSVELPKPPRVETTQLHLGHSNRFETQLSWPSCVVLTENYES